MAALRMLPPPAKVPGRSANPPAESRNSDGLPPPGGKLAPRGWNLAYPRRMHRAPAAASSSATSARRRWSLPGRFLGAVALLALGGSCGACLIRRRQASALVSPHGVLLTLPDYPDREIELSVPTAPAVGAAGRPLLVVFHGGGGSRQAAEMTACPNRDTSHPKCLSPVAEAAGFVVARPNGTGGKVLRNVRTWNAGGGQGDFQCVSGRACKEGVDDLAYFNKMLDGIASRTPIDRNRVYVTGFSNGAAFAHRVACALGARIAGLVAVSGTNQVVTDGSSCAGPVPLLQIHGTADPCWAYAGGPAACAQEDGGKKQSVAASMKVWEAQNGCDGGHEETRVDDVADDGTVLVRVHATGCRVPTELWRIEGGGHTWPSGASYLHKKRIGELSREATNDDIVGFLRGLPSSR
jgi:polyhydroxybutyrate depolymerase